MDLAQALNAPEDVAFSGRVFSVRQLKLSEWAALQAWLKREFPSPYTTALRSIDQAAELGYPVSPETRDAALKHAAELSRKWPPLVGSAAWLRALDSVEGGPAKFVEAALAAGGHAPAEGEAAALAEAATGDDWAELLRVVYYGRPPGPKAGEAATATAAATPTPTPTTPSTTGGPASTP